MSTGTGQGAYNVAGAGVNTGNVVNTSANWTNFTTTFTTGSSCASPPYLSLTATAPYGSTVSSFVFFDDLSVTVTGNSTNLLQDPGFENSITIQNWTTTNSRPTQSLAHGGITSLVMQAGGQASQTISGAIPNTSYSVSAWY